MIIEKWGGNVANYYKTIIGVFVALVLFSAGALDSIAEAMGNTIKSLVTPEMGIIGSLILVIPLLFFILAKMEGLRSLIEPIFDLISIFKRD